MKTYYLRIQFTRESGRLLIQWFGNSARHAQGAAEYTIRPDAIVKLVPAQQEIDLQPLRAEITNKTITDEKEFRAADEFLLLRDLLTTDDFEQLGETLYHFLWRETHQALEITVRHRGVAMRSEVDPDCREVQVWFATNRKPVKFDDQVERFDSEQSADELTYGVCNVFIPKSHKPGSTGTAWWRRWIRLESDDSLQLRDMHALPHDVFWQGMSHRFQTWWSPGERNLFVLIHGFNVSFNDAALRAAQLGYDLKLPGEIAFFSWPSHGDLVDYSADEATITASVSHIAQFLHELSQHSGAERIHLFAHSMGNRGFLRALERLAADQRPALRLGHVFFCAPDEDVRTFKDVVNRYPHQYERRTLLVSPSDHAVFLSQWKHRYGRVGYVPPVTVVDEIETIEVGGFGMLDLGHGYFAEAARVIEDIREAIETRKPASDRKIPRPFNEHFAIDVR